MIRQLHGGYLEDARGIYRRSALDSDEHIYSASKRQVWASFADDESFADFVLGDHSLGWFEEGRLAGFVSFTQEGYLKGLYVEPAYQRRGVGSALLAACMEALTPGVSIDVVASEFSRSLFERFGFHLIEKQSSRRGTVEFVRYLMRLQR